MIDIFISYAREDRKLAKELAEALKAQGWKVWWDRVIPSGKTFDEVIEQAIDDAKCIVVLWSKISVKSSWVRTEAAEGAERGILVPIQIEEARPVRSKYSCGLLIVEFIKAPRRFRQATGVRPRYSCDYIRILQCQDSTRVVKYPDAAVPRSPSV